MTRRKTFPINRYGVWSKPNSAISLNSKSSVTKSEMNENSASAHTHSNVEFFGLYNLGSESQGLSQGRNEEINLLVNTEVKLNERTYIGNNHLGIRSTILQNELFQLLVGGGQLASQRESHALQRLLVIALVGRHLLFHLRMRHSSVISTFILLLFSSHALTSGREYFSFGMSFLTSWKNSSLYFHGVKSTSMP